MTAEEIQALLELQGLDLKLIEYERHNETLARQIADIEGPVNLARAARDRVAAELAQAQSQHRHFELELVTNNERFKKLQTQQMGVRNQVEYEAFNHEMDALKDRADALEESGLKWIERLEEAKLRLPETESALAETERVAGEQRAALDARTAELKRIHDEAAVLQAPLVEKIPGPVIAYYRRLRRRGRPPFVGVVKRGACGGCGFTHPPQRLQEIKQGAKMLLCEQCGRIQVWVPQEEEQVGF
ncbi:MAG: zinc ribbon domain-containing protein [Candidatus Eiseniibacteriota bacterium]